MLVVEGKSLKYSVNMLATCISYYYGGPGCLINYCKLCCFLHGCYIYVCPASPEIAVTFLVESYKHVLERRSYVSCINFILLYVLPVSSFWHWQLTAHAQICGLSCVLFMILRGFIKPKALNLGVHLVLHCRRHCFFAMLSGFLETVHSPSFVGRLVMTF